MFGFAERRAAAQTRANHQQRDALWFTRIHTYTHLPRDTMDEDDDDLYGPSEPQQPPAATTAASHDAGDMDGHKAADAPAHPDGDDSADEPMEEESADDDDDDDDSDDSDSVRPPFSSHTVGLTVSAQHAYNPQSPLTEPRISRSSSISPPSRPSPRHSSYRPSSLAPSRSRRPRTS